MKTFAGLIALFFTAFSAYRCSENSNVESSSSFNHEKIYIWIKSDCAIGVDTELDSVMLFERVYNDTVIRGDTVKHEILKRLSVLNSPSLSDSIAFHCYRIICDTATTNGEVTDYAGDYVKIIIKKGTSDYTARLNSVSDWQQCSESYRAFYRLLKRNKLIE